ncbi:MAG: 4Fe-4S dicluster domain-containing protein, partial [Candidatus Heimdallarchaeota archaeon]
DDGPKVIISRGECAILAGRERRITNEKVIRARVTIENCTGCKVCMKKLGCPAFGWSSGENEHLIILPNCNGCGLCVQVCPQLAISIPREIQIPLKTKQVVAGK